MINRFWLLLFAMLLFSGCGWDGTPTRPNDFTPLTSITISSDYSTIANGTSTKLIATGHFSGQFSRDVTDEAVWSSNDVNVAKFEYTTAPNKNRVTGKGVGSAIITATVDGVSATYTLTVSNAMIKTMTISPATPDPLPKGRSIQFTVQGEFSDLSTQDMTFDAAWSSKDIAVATVSDDNASKGLTKAEASVGSVTISAVFPHAGGVDSKTGTKLLTVIAPVLDSITVTPANSSIAGLTKKLQFKATGNYSDGPKDITATATWKSSVEGVATIVSSGEATSIAVGKTSISATLNDSATLKDIIGITDLTVLDFTLQITPTPKTLSVAYTQQMTVTATFTDKQSFEVTSECLWTPDTPAFASVSPTGLVTAIAVGTATVKATYGLKQVQATIYVVP
jgi:hypothetical protein